MDRSGRPFPEQEHFLQKTSHRTRRSLVDKDYEDGDKWLFDDLNSQDNNDDDIVLSDDDVVLKDDAERRRTSDDVDDDKFYTLEAFGEKFELELQPFSDFISPSLLVQYYGRNESRIMPEAESHRHCFHRGKVRGDPNSTVSLSVCHNLVSTKPSILKQKMSQ